MENYEKFEQMIEDSGNTPDGSDPELESMFQIVQSLKSGQPHPSFKAQAKSKQLMLEEAKQVAQSSKARRISIIGSLYGWAVPAILLLAVAGVVLGNSQRNGVAEPGTIESGSGPALVPVESEATEEPVDDIAPVLEPADEGQEGEISPDSSPMITRTQIISDTADGEPVAVPVPEDLVSYPAPETNTGEVDQITVPDGEGGEVDIPVPQRPLPGSQINPPVDENGNPLVTPLPGDGREGGRNPDS